MSPSSDQTLKTHTSQKGSFIVSRGGVLCGTRMVRESWGACECVMLSMFGIFYVKVGDLCASRLYFFFAFLLPIETLGITFPEDNLFMWWAKWNRDVWMPTSKALLLWILYIDDKTQLYIQIHHTFVLVPLSWTCSNCWFNLLLWSVSHSLKS